MRPRRLVTQEALIEAVWGKVAMDAVLDELGILRAHLEAALQGRRQLVFVTGDPGIGKTALVEALLREAASAGALIARGTCIEQYGSGEAYLPILGSLG